MELTIFISVIVAVVVIGFFGYGGILLGVSKIFKVENSTYKKSLLILIIATLANFIIAMIFEVVNLNLLLSQILTTAVCLLIIYYLLKKYYKINWAKSLGVCVVFIIVAFTFSAVAAVGIRSFIAEPFTVRVKSMSPTYNDGDYIVINKFNKNFKRGDVVIARIKESKIFVIRRIIGLPGEKVEIRNGKVLINGQVLEENYYKSETKGSISGSLNEDEFFVLGDNRDDVYDSRMYGPIPRHNIKGKIFFVVPGLMNEIK